MNPLPEDLFHGQWQGRPSKLDAFKPYLDDRWRAHPVNSTLLQGALVTNFGYGYSVVVISLDSTVSDIASSLIEAACRGVVGEDPQHHKVEAIGVSLSVHGFEERATDSGPSK